MSSTKPYDTKLNRDVAIKLLPPHLLVSEDDRARFNREAKAAAALHHSNIATVFEINEIDGKPFIVMEFVEGKTLDFSIAKAPLKLEDAISIVIQIADGLGAAHKKDVVHRDVKASNILLGEDNKAKILDFGLAKTSMSTKLTQMGTTIGTVAYMSPEQVQGKEVDHRTDLWSLGVLLYEMIAGQLPYKAEYDQAIFYSIQNENPDPLTSIRTDVPMALEWIVNKLMAKDPAERYQSANDLIIDLKAVDLTDSGFSRISTSSAKTIMKNPVAKEKAELKFTKIIKQSAVMLFLIMAAIFITWKLSQTPEKIMHFNLSAIASEKMQILRSDMQVLTISPDGSSVVYTVIEGSKTALYKKSLDSFEITKIDEVGNVVGHPFFSPDGNWVGYNADSQLKRVSLKGGGSDVIYEKTAFRGASWGDNNEIIFSPTYSSGLLSISISGGTPEVLTTLDSVRGERTHRWPQVLPGGKHVIFTIGNVNSPNSYENAELAIVSLEDKKKHILDIRGEMARYIEPGFLLIAKNGRLTAAPFDLENYQLLAAPIPVLNDIEGDIGSGISYFAVSKTGSIVYLKGSRNQSLELVWLDKSGQSRIIPLPEKPYSFPRISPDGKNMVVNVGAQSANRDIWVYNFKSALYRRLTFGNNSLNPEWKKDSKGVYFASIDEDSLQIKYKSLNSNYAEEVIKLSSTVNTTIADISLNNEFMIFNFFGGAVDGTIKYMNMQTKEIKTISSDPSFYQFGGKFSPNTKYVAYGSNETGTLEVYIKSFPDLKYKWQVSTNSGFSSRWSPDGKSLYYVSNSGKFMVVPIQYQPVFSPGKPIELFDVSRMYFPNDPSENWDITPDGENFVMVQNAGSQNQINSLNYIHNWVVELEKALHIN